MKKKIIIILILTIVLSIGVGSFLIINNHNDDNSTNNNAIKNCNGKVMKNGNGIETCYIQTNDANKSCTDKTDCKGVCTIEKITDKTGKCSAFTPFSGCSYVLEDGKTIGPICE